MYMKVNSEKFKKVSRLLLTVSLAMGLFACEDDTQTDSFSTKDVPELLELSQAQKDVLAYLPTNIIIAHRGTEFWAPEESEAAMRWARNMGADYIECDLQKTATVSSWLCMTKVFCARLMSRPSTRTAKMTT